MTIIIVLILVLGFITMKILRAKFKVVSGYVTQFFPKPTMGGNQAIECLSDICQSKGVEIKKAGIINWLNPFKRKKLIVETVDRIAHLL